MKIIMQGIISHFLLQSKGREVFVLPTIMEFRRIMSEIGVNVSLRDAVSHWNSAVDSLPGFIECQQADETCNALQFRSIMLP